MRVIRVLSISILLVAQYLPAYSQELPQPPMTRVDPVEETIHGVKITDPYRWLEDQDNPETRAWIAAQTKYTNSIMSQVPARDWIKAQLGKWMRVAKITTPWVRGGSFFYLKRTPEQDQASIYVRHGWGGKETVLVDPRALSSDSMSSVAILDVSRDGKILAYAVHRSGADEGVVRFLDTASDKDLKDTLPEARYTGTNLTPNGEGVYYTDYGSSGSRVRFHKFGSDPSNDVEVFGKELTPDQFIVTNLSSDGSYLVFSVSRVGGKDNVDIYIEDLRKKTPVVPLVKDRNASFAPAFAGSHLYLCTNWKAPNGRVLEVDLNNPDIQRWREVVSESEAVMNLSMFNDFAALGGKLFVEYLVNGAYQIKIFETSGKYVEDLPFPTLGSLNFDKPAIYTNLFGTWEDDNVYYSFTSFAIPAQIFDYNTKTRRHIEWARVDGPINPDGLEIKRVQYESKDGTRIPLTLVYKKGLELDGHQPTLLSGYGGFGATVPATYDLLETPAAYWASIGGVFGWAGVRGGGEFGERWHRAGMLDKRQNAFDDLVAAAEWLIRNNYTSSDRLAISGMSNAGLMVGAALTQRPDLFKAVVCAYPLLDMIRYQKFEMGFIWVPEYGSADNPEQFKYLLKYSPYQNVKPGTKYPAVLFVSGDSDTRVAPLHARKMTALLQASTSSKNPVLLRYETSSGHTPMFLPVSKQIEELSDEFSFLFWQLGMIADQEWKNHGLRPNGRVPYRPWRGDSAQ